MTLIRDRITWLVYVRLGSYGWFLFAFTALQPLLRAEQGTSGTVAGLHGTFFAAGVIIAGLITARVAHNYGPMRGATLALWFFSGAIIVMALAPSVIFTLIASFLCGLGGSLAINLQQPVLLSHHEGKSGDQALAEGNGIGGIFGAVSVGLIGLLAAHDAPWRVVLLFTPAWMVIARVLFGRASSGEHIPDPEGREHGSLSRAYWIRWFGIVTMIAADFGFGFWAAALIAERTGSGLGSSTSLVMMFAGGMGIGRILGARLVHAFSVDGLLLLSIAFSFVAFFIFWASTVIWLSLIGLFLVGVGIALLYPLGALRAVASAPDKHALAFGRIGFGAGVAVATAPVLLGALTDQVGVVKAYLIVPVLLVVSAAVVFISPHRAATVNAS